MLKTNTTNGMGIHGSKEHCLDIAKTLQWPDTKKPPKCLTAGVLEFLSLERWDYIHTTFAKTLRQITLLVKVHWKVHWENRSIRKQFKRW